MDGNQSEPQAETLGAACPSDSAINSESSHAPLEFWLTKGQRALVFRAVNRFRESGTTNYAHVALLLMCLEFSSSLRATPGQLPADNGGPTRRVRFHPYAEEAEFIEEMIDGLLKSKLCGTKEEALILICWTFLQDLDAGITGLNV